MELLNLIERVLHRDAISILKPTAFSLLEGDPSAACQEVKVTVNGPCIVCRVERRISLGGIMTEIHPYLNDVVGVKKMCDYIIFYKLTLRKKTDKFGIQILLMWKTSRTSIPII